MLFKKMKMFCKNYLLQLLSAFVFLSVLLFYIIFCAGSVSQSNQNLFGYSAKVRDAVEQLDKTFGLAEFNVNMVVDSVANSYDVTKQKNKTYNLKFVEGMDGIVKSLLSNSPNADGAWFQLNASLPYSAQAYNWFEVKDNQFIDIKDEVAQTSPSFRQLTPSEDPYYFDAISSEAPVWSDVYTDADTNKKMITVSAPVNNNGTLIGVVGIDISLDSLQQILASMQLIMQDSELYLLDTKKQIIIYQLFSYSMSSKDKSQFENMFDGVFEGPVEYYDGLVKKSAIMLTLANKYKIVISIEDKKLFARTNQGLYLSIFLFFTIIVFIVLFFAEQYKEMEYVEPTKEEDKES